MFLIPFVLQVQNEFHFLTILTFYIFLVPSFIPLMFQGQMVNVLVNVFMFLLDTTSPFFVSE